MIVQMEPIKINLTKPIETSKVLHIVDMVEKGDELLIKLSGKECYEIYEGQELTFTRVVYFSGDSNYTISESVKVLYEDENHVIHTTKVKSRKIPLYNGLLNVSYVTGYVETNDGEYEETIKFTIKCKEDHNIFQQDLLLCDQEFYIKDINGNTLLEFSGNSVSVPLKYIGRTATSADCITLISKEETCGKRYDKLKIYQYDFASDNLSKNCLIINGINLNYISFLNCVEKMSYIETKYNPFYYYYILLNDDGTPSELDEDNKPIKHCVFYNDAWGVQYSLISKQNKGEKYIFKRGTINLTQKCAYWDNYISLSSPLNENTLGSNDNFNTKFIENLEESLIPDIIDMERIKYSPMVYDNANDNVKYYKFVSNTDETYNEIYTNRWFDKTNTDDYEPINTVYRMNDDGSFTLINDENLDFYYDYYGNNGEGSISRDIYNPITKSLITYNYIPTHEITSDALTVATSITLNFHFRKRKLLSDEESGITNSTSTSGNLYTDGWFIDEKDINTTWWNGMDYSGSTIDSEHMRHFFEERGRISDLIGYLNFTDNDIFYRKKKVSQTFVRFSFYNSYDPVEQKLLFYSTSFIDSTTLYGKYLKQLLYMQEHNLFNEEENMNVAVVMCSANTNTLSVDTKIVLTNEFDRTKSAEGFNIYLFAKDKNLHMENGEKTIYMKVEFNHAGNGKTIPMILWPKEGETYKSLTTENFIRSLYIPIKLVYINGKYSYYIPDAINNSDGNIDLVLFEPKLDINEREGSIEKETN